MVSEKARAYLEDMLDREMQAQVDQGRGDQPMSPEWSELYLVAIGVK